MNTEEINVLYYDEEIKSLNAFKNVYGKYYQLYPVSSTQKLLKVLAETEIHVIVLNQHATETSGIELFKSIGTQFPDPIKILLTANKNFEVLIDAIKQKHIYRYFIKPWDDIELSNCILNAYDKYIETKELKEMIEDLKKNNDDLTRFVYSISHELKAPLSSAIGVVHLAKLENLFNSQGGEYWSLVEECCKRLEYQISSSLDYYKNSHYVGIIAPFYFKNTIDTLINVHKRANDIDEQINFDIKITQDVDFLGDAYRMEIILSNLISNAIKYQRDDEQFKKVGVVVDANSTEATITISDNGIGISEKDIAKIFNQFYRGKSKSQGSGLGLYIVKEAVEKINGTINVKSTINSGTIFVVKIPNNKVNE